MTILCASTPSSSIKMASSSNFNIKKPDGVLCLLSDDSPKESTRGNNVKEELLKNMVNLKVPSALSTGKENSSPRFMYRCSCLHRRKASRKTPKKISIVAVPFNETCRENGKERKKSHITTLLDELEEEPNHPDASESYLEFSLEDVQENESCIPSVKPCTPEELKEMNRKWNLMKGKHIASKGKKKKTQKGIASKTGKVLQPSRAANNTSAESYPQRCTNFQPKKDVTPATVGNKSSIFGLTAKVSVLNSGKEPKNSKKIEFHFMSYAVSYQ